MREAMWREIFDTHDLVWTQRNLIIPEVAACVADEQRRLVEESAAAVHLHASARERGRAELSNERRDALLAKAELFLAPARGVVPDVELRSSALPIGLGLFAAQPFAAGDVIGEYSGLVCLIEDVEEQGAYAFEAWPGSPLAIDACTAGNHTRFVNHAPDASDRNLDVLQCVVAGSWHVFYVARRAIAVGEELFVDYGNEYWRRRRMSAF